MTTLLTQGSLARRADIPQARLVKLVRAGAIVPDFIAGKMRLFLPARLTELRAKLHPAGTDNVQS